MQNVARKTIRMVMKIARTVALLLAAGAAGGVWAGFKMTNPVTGEEETYTYKFVGTTHIWNGAQYWQNSDGANPSAVPGVTNSNLWDPILFDASVNSINITAGLSVEGWNLRMGLYKGANVKLNNLQKLQGGNNTPMWITVDGTSQCTIGHMANAKLVNSSPLSLYSAKKGGIAWSEALSDSSNGNGSSMPFHYYLTGTGSVAFNAGISVTGNGAHVIKQADVTLTGTSQVSSKTLVSFTSSTKTFTADAAIKVYDTDGSTLKKLVGVTAVRQSGATIANTVSQLTTANAVGSCEIVQCTNGIVLYYVDGAPSAAGYKPSININFTHSGGNLTTSADVGLAPYAVPGTVWNNYAVPSDGATSTQTSVYSIDATGTKSLVSGATVSISGTRGSHTCNTLTAASDLRHGYIDEKAAAGQNTPTVVVSGISYERYRVVIYAATDTADATFNYITVNGTDYTYVNSKLATGATAWGNAGAVNSANALAEGVNVLVSPVLHGSTATISGHKGSPARGCIAAVQIVEYTPEIGENDLLIELNGDETHTFNEAKTYDTVYVTGSGTLTFAGTASTATTLDISGSAAVNMNGSSLTPTAVTGTGTAIYTGELPPADKGWTDSANWTGTVWIKDFGSLSDGRAGASLTADMPNWGNSKSKVKFTNVKAYTNNSNLTCSYTLVLEDGTGSEEYAWRSDNGYQNNTLTVARLSGSGTFYDHSGPAATFTFNSFDGFTGKFDITSSGHQIKVPAGATLTVAQDSSIRFSDRGMLGTLNIAEGKTLTVRSKDGVSYDTGSSVVNVYGTLNFDTWRWTLGPNTTINLYQDAIVCGTGDGSAAMDFNVAGGSTIHALGNATLSCTIRNNEANGTAQINVDAGKTLTFSGDLGGSYGLKKQGDGILKLTGSIAKLPTIDAGTVLLGGNKKWNLGTLRDLSGYTLEAGSSIAITQTMAEYGSGVTTVTGIDSSIASITVNKKDGTTVTITPSDGAATLVESVVVSGAACWYDFTFTNTITTASGSSAGAVTLGKDADPAYGTLTDAADNTYSGLYAYCRPHQGINLGSTTQFTVALYGTMPNADNTILLDCGGCGSAGALLLASGSSANEAKLYYYNSSGLTLLAPMAATSCRTTPHLYVFEKISDHQVNIYLDGKLALAYVNNDITFTLTAGFQVASGYAGVPSGLNAIAQTATTDTTIIAMTRIYDRIISDAEMAVLKTEWPYFSPNGDSARTLASGETAADWTETGKWTVNNASADTPLANSVVTLTNSAEADVAVSVNLDGNTEYESVTFAGDAAISVALKSGYTGKIVPASTSFETDTTVAYNAMSLTEGAVEVAAGKTLTFDVSSLVDANWANVASIASIQLTGVATLGTESSIAVTPTTSGYWNLAAEADAGGNYYLTFTPNRETGSIYWQSGTYWNSTYQSGDSPAVFTTDAEGQNATKYFAGDTVIIPTTTKRYFGPISDGAIIQFDCSGTIDISKTDSLGYALKNANVTVASGTTLNFVNSWNGVSPEVYGGTISGAGKVKVESGKTLTLSNGATLASATALTGAGTVNFATVPTAQMTFDNWTGTVVLPAITSNVNLTLYGNSDSTIGITSLNTYLTSPHTEIDSTLRLDGAMTISAFSDRDYSFTKITGSGNLTFPNNNSPTSIAITELANYTGTLINNHESVGVAVTRVTKSVDVDGGALLLATNGVGEVSVSSFEVAGVAVSHYAAAGGFYRGAARYDGTVYKTFAEAIDAVEEDGALLSDITVLDGSATVPDGYYIADGTAGSKKLTLCAARSGEEGSYVYYNDVYAIFAALSAQGDLVLTVLDGQGSDYVAALSTQWPTLTYNSTDQTLYIVVAKIGETGYRSFAAAIDAASSGQTIQLISSSSEAITLDKTIILSGTSLFRGTFTGTGKVTLDALMQQTIVAAGWSGTVVLPEVTNALNLAYYGVSGSTVELTSMSGSGYFKHTGSTYNFDIAPNIKVSGSCTVLSAATSGLNYSFQTISGTGTLTLNNNANSISVAKVSDFSGSIVNNSAAALTIARLELSAAPTAGQCVLTTGGTGTVNVSSVYVGNTQQDVILEKKTDGIYVAAKKSVDSVVIAGDDEPTSVTVLDTGSNTAVDASSLSGKVAIPGTVAQITGVAAENLLLKVTYTPDGGDLTTGYYAGILTLDDSGNVSLDPSGTVTIADETVKVQPETAEDSPMTFTGSSPSFAVKAIPGLWYQVLAADSVDDGALVDPTGGTAVQATEATVSPAAPEFTGTVKFYKIAVGASQAALQ